MLDLNQLEFHHLDNQATRISRDTYDVQNLVAMLEKNWINPFIGERQDFVSLSTRTTAPPELVNDLLNALKTGEEAYKTFRAKRIEPNPSLGKFHDPLEKQNLKTFSSMNKKEKDAKLAPKDLILKADHNLFVYMIITVQTRDLEMKEVLSNSLGPLSWALATDQDASRKANKSAPAKELQKNATLEESFNEHSACIINGMALVQKVKRKSKDIRGACKHCIGIHHN